MFSAWELPAWGTEVLAAGGLALPVWGLTRVGKELNQVIFPFFLNSSLLNLVNLPFFDFKKSKLTYLIDELLACIHKLSGTIDASFDLLNSVCLALSPRILFMDLTLPEDLSLLSS